MKDYITPEYTTVKQQLEDVVSRINKDIKSIDKLIMDMVEGKTLHEINHMNLELEMRKEKAEALPSYKEFSLAGIDLVNAVKLSGEDMEKLNQFKTMVTPSLEFYVYDSGVLGGVQITKGKCVINDAGYAHIESQKIRLDKSEVKVWEKLQELRDAIAKDMDNKYLLYRIFTPALVNSFAQTDTIHIRDFNNLLKK